MDAGLSFQPGSSNVGGSPSSALAPLQSAVQVLSLNLPTAAARANFSPLAANGPSARGFSPESLVAQTLLKSLTGSGMPNQTLIDHLTAMLNSVGQSAPTGPQAPTITPGGGAGRPSAGAIPPVLPQATQAPGGTNDMAAGGLAAAGGRIA